MLVIHAPQAMVMDTVRHLRIQLQSWEINYVGNTGYNYTANWSVAHNTIMQLSQELEISLPNHDQGELHGHISNT